MRRRKTKQPEAGAHWPRDASRGGGVLDARPCYFHHGPPGFAYDGSVHRVGIAGFLHESNTFLNVPTPYQAFEQTCLVRGGALVERWKDAAHELGGMLEGCAADGLEAVPLYSTYAVPSGAIEAEAYERIADELLDELRAASPLDGLLLALHGATVSAAFPDADGEMLRRVREMTGRDLPIMVTFDLHANLSRQMAGHCQALIGYQTNPHIDQRERGREAAALLARTLRGEIRPVQRIEMPPMVLRNSRQNTAAMPAKALYDDMREVRSWPGILSASVAMGFLHSDVEEAGASFVAVADGDAALASRAARWMADRAWARREEFSGGLTTAEDAVRHAGAAERTPVAIMDIGDNVGGGSAANSTVLLAEMLRQGVDGGLIVLHDEAAVLKCIEAGVRSSIALEVGEPPLQLRGVVRVIGDGVF